MRLPHLLSVVVLAYAAPSPGAAQAHPARLADSLVRRVDSVFAAFDRTTSPGCALAIYRDGAIAYARGYGMANLEHALAITPRTVFDIGSTSKQFTAAAIVLLQQDGKLTLDDDVRRHIPELPQYRRPVTIRMLLNHTSGLRDYLTLFALRGVHFDGVTTDRDALAVILRQTATNFEPGSEYLYSNSGYFLLSEIVKRTSGVSLAQFAHERIFAPLGMHDTHFHDDHTMLVPRRATGYAPRRIGGGFAVAMSAFEQTGDGAVMTTVEDLLAWDTNFHTLAVGGRAMVDSLESRGRLTNGDTLPYALGLSVAEYRGLRNVRHGGAWAGYRADLSRFPSARTSIACLCNLATANPSRLADRVADVILADRLAPATTTTATPPAPRPATTPPATTPPQPDAAALARYTGQYYASELDASFEVTVDSTRLHVRPAAAAEPIPLRPTAADTFAASNGLVLTFTRGRDGRASAMVIDAGRVRGIRAERR